MGGGRARGGSKRGPGRRGLRGKLGTEANHFSIQVFIVARVHAHNMYIRIHY